MKHVRIGAEATVADGDSPFVAQRRRDEAMVHALDDEACEREAARMRAGIRAAEDADAGDLAQTGEHPPSEGQLVVEHPFKTELHQRLDRHAEGDRADDVRGASFLTVREIGPY